MSIKFLRSAANQYLSIPDSAGTTFPNANWTFGWVQAFDSASADTDAQYLFSTGAFASSGSLQVISYPPSSGVIPGARVAIQVDTNANGATPDLKASSAITSGVYLFLLHHTGTSLTLRHCPVLSSFPSDSSAVVNDGTSTLGTALDGASGIFIGARADLNAGRFADVSLARFFRFDGLVTDLEMAKLAYGMEITDLGKTPAWYFKMDTPSDIMDRGSLGLVATPHGSIATGTSPGFGYSSANSAPAITSNPAIVGGATVGSASSVTPGTTTGSPTPTNTYQWNINGVPVSGSTGTTYTPVSSDAGKTLTVTQTASNGAGSPAAATSAGVVVAAATSTIDVTQLIAERVYQRTGTTAEIALNGTYANTTPTSIEYQLYAVDGVTVLLPWAAISGVTISGGNWSGTPSIAQGGPYRLAVRSKSGTTVLATSNIKANMFMVGGDMYATGSSSANRWFLNNSGTGFTPNANVRQASSAGWSVFGTDGCAIKMANSFATQGSIPIGMVNCGVEGETLANWLNMSGSSWTNFASTLAANGGKMELLLMAMGSNDAANGIVVSRAQHAANLRQFISNVRTLTGQPNLPVVISGFNGRPGASAQQADFVRMAENDVGGDANVSAIQIVDLPLSGDNIHLTPAGFTTSGDRITYVQGRRMYGDGAYLRGPKETAITYTSSVIKIALQHRNGTDFTPATGIGGYVFTDDSGAIPLASVVRSAANEITITPGRAIVGVPVGTYLSGSGQAPSSSVMDNGAMSLPMNIETAMTATAAASSNVTGVTISPSSVTVSGGSTQQFTAMVQGNNPSQSVSWTKTSGVGSVSSSGLYTAPASTSSAQSTVIRATSVQDSTYFAEAPITVPAVVPGSTVTGVAVTPSGVTVAGGGTVDFDWVVLGTNGPSQAATVTTNLGVINSAGVLTAPQATNVEQNGIVTVTSVQDPSYNGQATFIVPASDVPPQTFAASVRFIPLRKF